MASVKILSLYFILFLSLSFPFSYSFPRLLQTRESVAVSTVASTVVQGSGEVAGDGKGLASLSAGTAVEDSTREVPTGPDPLHHNDNPA